MYYITVHLKNKPYFLICIFKNNRNYPITKYTHDIKKHQLNMFDIIVNISTKYSLAPFKVAKCPKYVDRGANMA